MNNDLDINKLKRNLTQHLTEAQSGYKIKSMGLRYNNANVMVGDTDIFVDLSFDTGLKDIGFKIQFKGKSSSSNNFDNFQNQSNLAKEIRDKIDNAVIPLLKKFEIMAEHEINKILKEVK